MKESKPGYFTLTPDAADPTATLAASTLHPGKSIKLFFGKAAATAVLEEPYSQGALAVVPKPRQTVLIKEEMMDAHPDASFVDPDAEWKPPGIEKQLVDEDEPAPSPTSASSVGELSVGIAPVLSPTPKASLSEGLQARLRGPSRRTATPP